MKKFLKWGFVLPLLAMMFSVAMVSCGDDDDDKNDQSGNYAELIIGTWTETGEWNGNYGPDYNGGYNYGYIFRINGSMTSFGSGKYDGTYRVSGNKIMIQDDYDVEECIIRTLTDNKLVLDWGDDEIETFYRVTDR